MPIPPGIERQHVIAAIEGYDPEWRYGFDPSTKYDLLYEGREFPPKAIGGGAAQILTGRAYGPEDFSGGRAAGQANAVLRRLEFRVVDRATGKTVSSPVSEPDWEPWELDIAVPAYFELLHDDIAGDPSAKRKTRRYLAVCERMGWSRNHKAVERKFSNISEVMHLEDLRFVSGLNPLPNLQGRLEDRVLLELDGPAGERDKLRGVPKRWEGPQPEPDASADLEVPPPAIPPRKGASDRRPGIVRSFDAARHDAAKRRLGRKGEEWAVAYERDRLKRAGYPEFAAKVEHVARTKGDGLGWDVESYTVAGKKRLLEVKTTSTGKKTPFVLTLNELEKWRDHVREYEVFRIFGFGSKARFYRLKGKPEDVAQLTTASWEVRPKGS